MAQTSSEIAAARKWFEEGIGHEEAGRWQQALTSFRQAAQVKQTPQILFHQGLCEKHLGLLVEAELSLSRAASMARKQNLGEVERAANTELEEVRERTPVIHIELPAGKEPDEVRLDGETLSPVFLTKPVPVNPGSHELVIVAGGVETRKSTSIQERETATIRFESWPAPSPGPASPPPATAPPPSPAPGPREPVTPPPSSPPTDSGDSASHSTLAWTLVAGGVLAAGGGVAFWMQRNEQLDRIDDICPSRGQCPPDRKTEVDDLEGKGTTYSALGIGLIGTGLAAATVGVVILSTGDDSEQSSAAIAPVVGPGQAGAWVQGRF